MLTQYGGYPAFEVQYDTGGHLVDPQAERAALDYYGAGAGSAITDLFFISHGWNNDMAEARALYGAFFNAVRSVQSAVSLPGRSFGIVAVFWPSKRFADANLIAGGAAALGDTADARLNAQLDTLAEVFGADPSAASKIAHARSLLPALEHSASAQDDYVATLSSLVPKPRYEADEGMDEAISALGSTSGHLVLERLSTPFVPVTPPVPGAGGAAGLGVPVPGSGGAAGVPGGILGGIKAAAGNLGDIFTYYAMKDRAGIVGRTGAVVTVRALRGLRAGNPPRVHLVGHSFGARLVTAAANALSGAAAEAVQSMTLLEAAYSHNGLAQNWDGAQHDGAFRSVVAQRKVNGPILVTHSAHDFPVGTAYPLASRLMNQVASALFGGPEDKFGGMGRNGARHTPEAVDDKLFPVGTPPQPFGAGKSIRNLNGDGPPPAPTITSHGDVAKPEIAYALLEAIK